MLFHAGCWIKCELDLVSHVEQVFADLSVLSHVLTYVNLVEGLHRDAERFQQITHEDHHRK